MVRGTCMVLPPGIYMGRADAAIMVEPTPDELLLEVEKGRIVCPDARIIVIGGIYTRLIAVSLSDRVYTASSAEEAAAIILARNPERKGLKLTEKDYNSYRWTEITTVFQAAQNVLNPTLRIKDHFLETAMAHNSKLTKREILDRAKELCAKVRLEERVLDSYPHQLSGGMKQRVIIALSLLLEPELLILDEPTTALDVITQWYILDILRKIHEESGITMVFCTHDVAIIGSVVDRIAVMYAGQIVEYGKLEDVFLRPAHPYSRGLIRAVPSLRDDLLDLAPGCRFAPRCFLKEQGICDGITGNLEKIVSLGDNQQYTLCGHWKEVKRLATTD